MAVDREFLVYKVTWVQDHLDSMSAELWGLWRRLEEGLIADHGLSLNANDMDEEDAELLDELCDAIAAENGIRLEELDESE